MEESSHNSGGSRIPLLCPTCKEIWWREELKKIQHQFYHSMKCKNGHVFEYKS